ncbi:MAG: hypothetical protein E6I08_12695 [Chloroflexi bacterium]|nr:MAG: hypothetical protein E6I08_12695 [Chloroflexota bacterium]
MKAGGALAAPRTVDDTGLRKDLVASLVLRTIAYADQLSGAAIEARIGLPFESLQPIIEEFQRNQLMDTTGFSNEPGLESRPIPVRMSYTVSSAGRQRAAEMSAVQTRYLGPCPIRYEDYLELVRGQVGKANITDAMLKKALGELQLEQHVIDQIGGAMVSRSSLFIFGAPGNGKSTITERMALLMGAPIEIPHAVAIGDEIVRVIDPVFHRIAEGEQPADRRLVKIERPVVVVGGELKLSQLDLAYDPQNRYYEAPVHWKANAGVFVIDDFGRQEVPPMRLLNRFIVPMEKKVDYLDLSASGRKIELPFLCQVVFSTNLSPSSPKNKLPWVAQAVPFLLNLYTRDKRPLRGSHPRMIIARLVDFAAYRQQPPQLNPTTLQEAYDACFNAALGGIDSEDWAQPPAS